jgi:hypothetical protein
VKSSARALPIQILFPGPESWELWDLPLSGELVEEAPGKPQPDGPSFSGPASKRVFALPVSSTYAIPLWVFGRNAEEWRGAAELHLEKDGLSRPDEPAGFDFERILEQENRALVRVDALAKSTLSLTEGSLAPDAICLAPRLLRIPDDQIVVWKELGRFVTAMASGGKLIYHNVLASSSLDGRAAEEVVRWAKQFQFQGMVKPCTGITVWAEDADVALLREKSGLPVAHQPRPTPHYTPACSSAILPQFAAELQKRETRKLRTRQLLAAGALVAGGAILAFFAATALALHHQKTLRDRIAALSPAASEIEQIQQRWGEVAAAVDPGRSPLEMMLLIRQLPSAGEISLTRFERSADRLALKGTAASPSEALKFLGAISKSESLSGYQWTYAQPLIAQDGTATFEIEGTLTSVNP